MLTNLILIVHCPLYGILLNPCNWFFCCFFSSQTMHNRQVHVTLPGTLMTLTTAGTAWNLLFNLSVMTKEISHKLPVLDSSMTQIWFLLMLLTLWSLITSFFHCSQENEVRGPTYRLYRYWLSHDTNIFQINLSSLTEILKQWLSITHYIWQL